MSKNQQRVGRKSKPKHRRLSDSVATKVSPPLRQNLEKVVEQERRTVSDITRLALEEYVERKLSEYAATVAMGAGAN